MRILKKLPLFMSIMLRVVWNKNETQFDKIEIYDFQKNEKIFENHIISSLELIKTLSPIQYKTIQSHVDSIVQIKKLYQDSYIIQDKMCVIDNSIQWKELEIMHIYYAGILIYMSTYGCLLTKFSDFYIEDKVKFHKICIQMEKKFYKKVEKVYPKYKGTLIDKFIG